MNWSEPDTLREPQEPAFAIVRRIVLYVAGAIMLGIASGLWLLPGAGTAPAILTMKLGLTAFLLPAGLCCLALAHKSGVGVFIPQQPL
ncbi:hypothetical protein [Roseivivax isoporae]|uniref:Uncharacterized protein n=1 Tax=Roseivivax isoporae LMG 25204 TaxID=1449351 RepID=X7FFI7_9RHOB|nr:hypothetical protein [Roseivivax isoporae]ETX30799.1 hypothetical protein RISW2_07630 [Roseivivax isoporae LMG 25204]